MSSILSTDLCTGIAEWFRQNTYFNGYFKSINDYVRLDTPTSELPSISVYFKDPPQLYRNQWNETGKVAIDVAFSLKEQRSERAKEIITALEMIRGNLLTNPSYIQKFVSTNYVAGLLKLNTQTEMPNLSELKQKMLNPKNGSLVITFAMYYEISVLLNQRAMWKQKKDFFSPIQEVYNEGELGNIDVILEKE